MERQRKASHETGLYRKNEKYWQRSRIIAKLFICTEIGASLTTVTAGAVRSDERSSFINVSLRWILTSNLPWYRPVL